jgi:hypothetical protein
MLETGEYSSAAELAKAEKVNDSYVSRILRLTLLAPDIIEAIVDGRQPSTMQVDDFLKPLPGNNKGGSCEVRRVPRRSGRTRPRSGEAIPGTIGNLWFDLPDACASAV